MAEEKQIQPVVHETGVGPLFPGNPRCYENLLDLRSKERYIRNLKFNFNDPFDPATNSFKPIWSTYNEKKPNGEVAWQDTLSFELRIGAPHGIIGTPLVVLDGIVGALGDLFALQESSEEAKKNPAARAGLFAKAGLELVLDNCVIDAETANSHGYSAYFDVLLECAGNIELFAIACLCHPDAAAKIERKKDSTPIAPTNIVLDEAKKIRDAALKFYMSKVDSFNELISNEKKRNNKIAEQQAILDKTIANVYKEVYGILSPRANNSLRHKADRLKKDDVPPGMHLPGTYEFDGRTLNVTKDGDLFLLRPHEYKVTMHHRLFYPKKSDESKQTQPSGGRKPDARSKFRSRNFGMSAFGTSSEGNDKDDVINFMNNPNSKNPRVTVPIGRALVDADSLGFEYAPLRVSKFEMATLPGGKMAAIAKRVSWNPEYASPQRFLMPGAVVIPTFTVSMKFNAGPKIPYKIDFAIKTVEFIKQINIGIESASAGSKRKLITNSAIDEAVKSGAIDTLFAAPPQLAIEPPSVVADEDLEEVETPGAKRHKAIAPPPGLQDDLDAVARDIEENE